MKLKKVLAIILCVSMCFSFATAIFAANEGNTRGVTFSATLNNDTLTYSDEAQTVEMMINASEEISIYTMGFKFNTEGGIKLTSAENATLGITSTHLNLDIGQISWFSAGDDISTTNLVKATFEIPAGLAAGDYVISTSAIELSDTYGSNTWEEAATVSATLTITDGSTEPAPTEGYTANISTTATNNTVVNGDNVVVNVNVGGVSTEFSSAEIVLNYDPDYLNCTSATTTSTDELAPDFAVDNTNGTVTIRDYGAAISTGNGVYSLTFSTAKGGNTDVELNKAAFSTEVRAETQDLLPATGVNTLGVTINHKVTVNNQDAGSVAPDGSYEYTIPSYDATNNTYPITVKMGGQAIAAPTPDQNGKITIANVIGDLEISYEVKPNEYTVTWNEVDVVIANKVTKVIHGNDITFDVPANQDPVGTTDGYKYTVTVTETDEPTKIITATSENNGNGLTYTIDGDLIEDDITITVKKETVSAGLVTVTVEGKDLALQDSEGTDLGSSPATVAKGTDVVLVLTPEAGYTYEVSVGGEKVTLTGNKYTIEDIAASVEVSVTKTIDKGSVNVQKYLTLDDTTMWLVTINGNGTTQIEDKTYSYAGENMFWSSKYKAYCYLVVEPTLDKTAAVAAIGSELVSEAAVEVNYDSMDVNKSGTMDLNDAQLVWNMYSIVYKDGFTTNVTMEKFLRADLNEKVGIETLDAQVIVNSILGITD